MNPARWETVKSIFAEALERDEAGRGAWLDGRCDGDAELRRDVDRLLSAHRHPTERADGLEPVGAGPFLRASDRIGSYRVLRVLGVTLYRLRWPVFTIVCMLAIAFTTRYGGLDATLGLAFTKTGVLYPVFAALLGWLGVALTGSGTSSNALFGGLQTVTAHRLVADGVVPLSVDQASVLLASANSTGGVMGKMIDAQSIVVAGVATGQSGGEGKILRAVFWHSLALACLAGLLVLAQAYLFPGVVP